MSGGGGAGGAGVDPLGIADIADIAGGGGGVCAGAAPGWAGCSLTGLEMGGTGTTGEHVEGACPWCASGEFGAQSEGELL